MADIRFNNVTKKFGNTLALDNISFQINDNDFFCLFGPPLSGKSTILRLILGLEKPDAGEILIGGKPVNAVSAAERNVAMVFQNLALFPHMSARDNVIFPLVERNVSAVEIEKRLDDVSGKLHIRHILHKPPGQLSGGERQRVAIARALVRDPVAYLMDDPISALDARLRESTRVELKRIQKELGRTLVYVTHDQEEAMSVADQMAILIDGRIQQIGTPTSIYTRPKNIEVAKLLGAPAMNILSITSRGKNVEAAGGALQLSVAHIPANAINVGIRPEDIKIGRTTGSKDATLSRVYQIEPLGGTTVITIDTGQGLIKAALRGQPAFKPDEIVNLTCDLKHSHFFDRNGLALAM